MKQKGQKNFTRKTKGFGRVNYGKAGYTDGAGCSKKGAIKLSRAPGRREKGRLSKNVPRTAKIRYPRTINWTGVICRRFFLRSWRNIGPLFFIKSSHPGVRK